MIKAMTCCNAMEAFAKLVKSPYSLPTSDIKILHSEAVYGEDFSAVWPYQGVFYGGKINNSANLPTFSHSNCRRSEPRLGSGP